LPRRRSFQITRDAIQVAHKARNISPEGKKFHALLSALDGSVYKEFQRLFDSLLASWALAFNLRSYNLRKNNHRLALDGFLALSCKVLLIYVSRSAYQAAKYLKKLSKECQRLSVMSAYEEKPLTRRFFRGLHSNPSVKSLWRFGSLGRSLPPNPGGKLAAIEQHKLDYSGLDSVESKPGEVKAMKRVPQEILTDLREFSRRLAEHFAMSLTSGERNFARYLLYQPQATQSASLNFTRGQGGNWEGYARLLRVVKSDLEVKARSEDVSLHEDRAIKATVARTEAVLLMLHNNRPLDWANKDLLLFQHYRRLQSEIKELASGPVGLSNTVPGRFLNIVLADELRREVNSVDYKLKAKVMVLDDPSVARGLKTRVVTKSAIPELIGSKPINSLLLRMLKRVPELSPILSGKTLDEVKRLPFKYSANRELLGADLSRASDLIQHNVAQHIMRGIGEGLGWSPSDMKFVHKCCGSVSLDYGDETIESKRGELMGMPYAFSILCILNVWAARRAEGFHEKRKRFPRYPRPTASFDRRLASPERLDRSFPDTRIPFTLPAISSRCRGFGMGDDFVLYGTGPVLESYMHNLLDAGLLLNPSKQFRDPLSTVFTEERYELLVKNGKTVFQRLRSVRASTIVYAKGRRNDGARIAGLQPDYVRIGAVFRNVDESIGNGRHKRTAFALLRVFHLSVLKRIQKVGIPLYWPRSLGGAGIVGKPWVAPRHFRTAAAVILTKEDKEVRKHTLELRWLWQSHMPSPLANVVSQQQKQVIQKYETSRDIIHDNYKPDTNTTDAEEALRGDLLNFLVPEFGLVRQNNKRRRMNLTTLGRRINVRIRKLANLWKSAKPMTNERVKTKLAAVDSANHYNAKILSTLSKERIIELSSGQLSIGVALNRERNKLTNMFRSLTLEGKSNSSYLVKLRQARRHLHKEKDRLYWKFETLAISPQDFRPRRDQLESDLEIQWSTQQKTVKRNEDILNELKLITSKLKALKVE
jgi:hypothetical protein